MYRFLRCSALLLVIASASTATATTYTVGGPLGVYPTIQSAIDAALLAGGANEVAVHTGIYAQGFNVPSTMTSGSLDISGGWDDSFSFQVANAAANTQIVPAPGQRGVLLKHAGGLVTVSDFEFYGASTSVDGAGVRVEASGTGSANVLRNVFRSNVVTRVGNLSGAGLSVDVHGSGQVLVQNNAFSGNRGTISSGNGVVSGASVSANCYDNTTCVITDNTVRNSTAETNGAPVYGAGIYLNAFGAVTAQLDRNLIEGITIGPQSGQMVGRSLTVSSGLGAHVYARGNRLHAGAPLGGSFQGFESYWALGGQSVATFGDSLVAKSPLRAVYVYLTNSAAANLVNLTLVDNASDVFVNNASTESASVSNSLIGTPFASNTFNGTQLSHNQYGLTLAYLAPAIYDYSMRRQEPLVADAGDDLPPGGLGAIDIGNGARSVGAHVDIGAWERSDRIFADRVDQ